MPGVEEVQEETEEDLEAQLAKLEAQGDLPGSDEACAVA